MDTLLEDLKLIFSMAPKYSEDDYKSRLHSMETPLLAFTYDKGFIIDKCYIKESKIQGLGVFVKDDIKTGELITLYPPHFTIYHPKKDRKKMAVINSRLIEVNKLKFDLGIKKYYTIDLNERYSICGHPKLIDDPIFLGHMINDGCRGHSYNEDNLIKKDCELYNKLAPLKNNSKFEYFGETCIGIVATKDIKKDEEILVTYNYNYWIDHDKN
jgi:SET domain-containing protein